MSQQAYHTIEPADLQVRSHVTTRPRKARRGEPALPSGSTIFYIQHLPSRHVYAWVYLRETKAEYIRDQLIKTWDKYTFEWNFRGSHDATLHSSKEI